MTYIALSFFINGPAYCCTFLEYRTHHVPYSRSSTALAYQFETMQKFHSNILIFYFIFLVWAQIWNTCLLVNDNELIGFWEIYWSINFKIQDPKDDIFFILFWCFRAWVLFFIVFSKDIAFHRPPRCGDPKIKFSFFLLFIQEGVGDYFFYIHQWIIEIIGL